MATKKSAAPKAAAPKKDVAAFVDYIHTNKKARMTLKKGWDQVIKDAKKQGYKFTKAELHQHLKKKYNVTSLPKEDEPDTCICI